MRVTRVTISKWRNFQEVDLRVDPDAPLICLVGENGTGKSAILELLSAIAQRLGISQGLDVRRGNFFDEVHDVTVEARVPVGADELPEHLAEVIAAHGNGWRGELRLTTKRDADGAWPGPTITAVGVPTSVERAVAEHAMEVLRGRKETQHLYLDADRAYPVVVIHSHEYNDVINRKWEDPDVLRSSAYRSVQNLYTEWLKYLYGREQRTANQFQAALRRAEASATPAPTWTDWLANYRAMLQAVMPHLKFVGAGGIEGQTDPTFDSSGTEIPFSKLSGGEREIAFLVGQIERFELRRGLLLIDEPELHLNPDLLRTWLQFTRGTIDDGQIWISTHSIDAAEVATPTSTFILERDAGTRLTTAKESLDGKPVMLALSAAVGSPGFAVHNRRFIYVEGDRRGIERQRFYDLVGGIDVNRFLEGGGCGDILRTLDELKSLAESAEKQLHVGGIIDRDFRTDAEVAALTSSHGVHVLGCHEVENLYLQPDALAVLLERNARAGEQPADVLRICSDKVAGLWVVQHAINALPGKTKPEKARNLFAGVDFSKLTNDWLQLRGASVATIGQEFAAWGSLLDSAFEALKLARVTEGWWRLCAGKQTSKLVAANLNLTSVTAFQRIVGKIWDDNKVSAPEDLVNLREYVQSIGTAST